MKKVLLSTVAFATLTVGALAADLPVRRAPAPFVAVPVFTWTGFYVGANVGYGWQDRNRDTFFGDPGLVTLDRLGAGGFPGAVPQAVVPAGGGFFGQGNGFGFANDRNRGGILGGVQAGYNWQVTPGGGFVIGVEADIQAMSHRRNNNGFGAFGGFGGFQTAAPTAQFGNAAQGFGVAPGTTPNVAFFNNVGGNGFGTSDRNGNWFGTARLRAGFAVDRALFYLTGGLAFTDRGNNNNNFGAFGFGTGFASGAAVVAAAPVGFFTGPAAVTAAGLVNPTGAGAGAFGFGGRNNGNDIGWALGGGVEYAFTNNLSVKLEGLWLNFGRNNNNGFASGCCVAGQVVGVTNTGAPITATNNTLTTSRRDDNDMFVARVGINYRFGS